MHEINFHCFINAFSTGKLYSLSAVIPQGGSFVISLWWDNLQRSAINLLAQLHYNEMLIQEMVLSFDIILKPVFARNLLAGLQLSNTITNNDHWRPQTNTPNSTVRNQPYSYLVIDNCQRVNNSHKTSSYTRPQTTTFPSFSLHRDCQRRMGACALVSIGSVCKCEWAFDL